MSCDVKFIEADSASFQAKDPDTGETLLELPEGVGALDISRGSG